VLPRELIASRPSWVRRQISNDEVFALTSEIISKSCTTGIEVGVASGFSSAVIFSALSSVDEDALLYSYDLSRKCYFDSTRNTGDAFFEMLGERTGFKLSTGVTSSEIDLPRKADFGFIDACHENPWPALDLLAMSRFLADGALVALDDIDTIFRRGLRHTNGGRDLYRAWPGKKYQLDGVSGLGFLIYDRASMLRAIQTTFALDWDAHIHPDVLGQYMKILSRVSPLAYLKLFLNVSRYAGTRDHARRHASLLDGKRF